MLFGVRVIYSERVLEYRNLVWNLVLAWVPYAASIFAAALHTLLPKQWWLLPIPGFVWLLFFPNAPYIVITDFLHLEYRPPVPLWYDIGLIASYAFTGTLLAVVSLNTMHIIIKKAVGWFIGWVFAFTSLGLCGMGIYLCRFGRFNSWDLFFNPKAVLDVMADRLLDPLDNLRFISFTLMFTAILIVVYLTFTALNHHTISESKNFK